ncbi:thioredoxin domain-containing protein [Roseovarius sp. MS2]|uniref:thioredoxin domain-containing protein n=1 Tax=Roseovarius sp. MS2 TaxID=3390728 RepID=UPI003EDBBFD3
MARTQSRRTALMVLGGTGAVVALVPIFAGQGGHYGAGAQHSGTARSHAALGTTHFDDVPLRDTDFVLGAEDAPITLIKYGSLTCPHCAAFHVNTASVLKRDHIPEGRVRYVHRHFPLNQPAMAAAMLLHSGNGSVDRFYGLLDILYTEQREWASGDYISSLRAIAGRTGVAGAEFEAILADEKLGERIIAERDEGSQVYGVTATPTLLVNGGRYSGNHSIAQLEPIFEQLT